MPKRRPTNRRRTAAAVLAVTAVALLARLYQLGWRVAHQDEGRVADWILHYMRTGTWEYRPIIHGPFIPHVNGVLFTVLEPSDFVMRLAPALVGGLLPLAAWLLRDRLRDTEVIGVAVVLAANPVVLYYSRFMRNDLLLAAFATVAFALVVRTIDTGQARYLYAAGFTFGLAMATKENVLLYPVCWAGGVVLLLDHRLRLTDAAWLWQLRDLTVRTGRTLRRWAPHIAVGLLLWAGTTVAFYAPKPALYDALTTPSQLPGVLDRTVFGSWQKFARTWADPAARSHSYLSFAAPYWEVLYRAALPTSALALLGFVVDRYRGESPRDVIALAFYWGAFSVLGYPIVMDIVAAWSNVHALVPLAIPAGVGLGGAYRYTRSMIDRVGQGAAAGASVGVLAGGIALSVLGERGVGALAGGDPVAVLAGIVLTGVLAGIAMVFEGRVPIDAPPGDVLLTGILVGLLLGAGAQTAAVASENVYEGSQEPDNILVQYAQPAGKMQPVLADIERIATSHDSGPDVLFYGEVKENADGFEEYYFYTPPDYFRDSPEYGPDAPDANEAWPAWDSPAPGWFSRLPFPWYTGQFGADVTSTTAAEDLADGAPPVVIAYAKDDVETDHSAEDVAPYLEGYERYEFQLYQWAEPIVIFVDRTA